MKKISVKGNYSERRRVEYPKIEDQLDKLFHAIKKNPALCEQFAEFIEPIDEVKRKFPKPQ